MDCVTLLLSRSSNRDWESQPIVGSAEQAWVTGRQVERTQRCAPFHYSCAAQVGRRIVCMYVNTKVTGMKVTLDVEDRGIQCMSQIVATAVYSVFRTAISVSPSATPHLCKRPLSAHCASAPPPRFPRILEAEPTAPVPQVFCKSSMTHILLRRQRNL